MKDTKTKITVPERDYQQLLTTNKEQTRTIRELNAQIATLKKPENLVRELKENLTRHSQSEWSNEMMINRLEEIILIIKSW